jgi:hypothetical protein
VPALSSLTRPKLVEKVIHIGDGDQVTIMFDRNRITPAWVASAQTDESESDPFTVPKALAQVIHSWDVTDDDGHPIEPSAETLGLFSVPAQGALLDQILSAAFPSSEEGNGSSNTSSTAATDSTSLPVSLQNGPAPLPSPTLSASPSPT